MRWSWVGVVSVVAVLAASGCISTTQPESSGFTLITQPPLEARPLSFSWSPDSSTLIFAAQEAPDTRRLQHGLWRYDLASNKASPLRISLDRIWSPLVTPDSKNIIFVGGTAIPKTSPEKYVWDLIEIPFEGGETVILLANITFSKPALSPDGTKVVVGCDSANICIVNRINLSLINKIDFGSPVEGPSIGNAAFLWWDDKRILLSLSSYEKRGTFLLDLTALSIRKIFSEAVFINVLTLATTDSRIVYHRSGNGTWMELDLASGSEKAIMAGDISESGRFYTDGFGLSPDGRYLFYHKSLYDWPRVLDRKTGSDVEIRTKPSDWAALRAAVGAVWSPDGKKVAFGCGPAWDYLGAFLCVMDRQ